MKFKKHLLKITATVLSAVMLLSSVCITAFAADIKTPIGYIEAVPTSVAQDDVLSDPAYLRYKQFIEEDNGVVSAIYNGLINMETEIDIRSYEIPKSDMKVLMDIFFYCYPEIWYMDKYTYYYSSTYATRIVPKYLTDSDLEEKKEEFFEAAAEKYLPLIDDSMDDFTKAVTLHDALVLNTYYTKDLENDRGNNYTYMVQNYGVCQYYAECYAYLLAQCGIKSEIVSSKSMNHAWLKVQINGKYYNVDSTWDDPTPDRVGLVHHGYFLLSDDAFQTADSSANREDSHWGYRSIHAADDTTFDSFDNLHKFTTQLCKVDGTFYAITADNKLVTYNYFNDSLSVVKTFNFIWTVPGTGAPYPGNYSSLALYDGKLYYNGPDMVYEYDPATGQETEFAASTVTDKRLYGLRIIDDKLWGVYAPSPNEGYIEPTFMRNMKSTYTITVDSAINGGKVTADVQEAKEGDTVTLSVIPDEGYSIGTVKANNDILTSTDSTYTFTMPAENVTVTADFFFTDGIGARVVGHSLSLAGDIGVNFYMELDSAIANSDTAYLHFVIPTNEQQFDTKDILVKNADTKFDAAANKTYYIFKCDVAAKEISSEITAQIIDGEKKSDVHPYSVREYAEYLLTHTSDNTEFAAAAPLVKAMLNYGAYSQLYFDRNAGALANQSLTTAEKQLGVITAGDINKNSEANLPDDVTFTGATLSLKSKTTLSLYFKSKENRPLNLTCGGMTTETQTINDEQVIRIRDIAAKKLSEDVTVNVSSQEGNGTITYSPLTYCCKVLAKTDANPKLQDVVTALYWYWKAADLYFPD